MLVFIFSLERTREPVLEAFVPCPTRGGQLLGRSVRPDSDDLTTGGNDAVRTGKMRQEMRSVRVRGMDHVRARDKAARGLEGPTARRYAAVRGKRVRQYGSDGGTRV